MVNKSKCTNLILLGSPGSGKGTQARLLKKKYGFYHLATGDIFREAVEKGTPTGKKVQRFINKGRLVPDKLVSRLVQERITEISATDNASILLDGYPRNVVQAKQLDKFLARLGKQINAVIKLQVNADELAKRLAGRWVCQNCGSNYNIYLNPPKQPGICDVCGGPLFQRADDQKEVISHRLRIYQEETKPLIDFYSARNVVHVVPAEGEVEEVLHRISQILDSLK